MKAMHILIAVALVSVASTEAFARGGGGHSGGRSSGGSHSVSGHVTSRGTYVAPHHATNPNGTKRDNWSTKGNINPFTGKVGTKNP